MAFNLEQVSALLVACHRRCCICHRFCGVKIETDHIIPGADGGTDEIENAIPVCFECHAEIHLYNPRHPKGRKFRPEELRGHRDQWIEICKSSAQFLASVPPVIDAGPVQALVEELEFNRVIAAREQKRIGAPFEVLQFDRCITDGALSVMADDVRETLFSAYAEIKTANQFIHAVPGVPMGSDPYAQAFNRANDSIRETRPHIERALIALKRHLTREP